jgi:peptidyl-prolyl cis-trans isomerase D
VRVQAVTPAHIPALADVQDGIREQLTSERAADAARQAGEAALKSLQSATPDAAAGAGFGNAVTVSRQSTQGLATPVIQAVVRLAPGQDGKPSYVGVPVDSDYTLVRLDRVDAGTVDAAARTNLAAQISSVRGQAESDAVLQLLRQEYGVQVLPAAEQAIKGENPSDAS